VLGISDPTTQANTKLDVIAGNLTGSVPRMEGPQSDADREYYMQQAGRVADKTLPIGDRLAAIGEIDKVMAKYANINTPQKTALDEAARTGVVRANPMSNGRPKVNPSNIPMDAVKDLKKNPGAAAQFDEIFGPGAAKMVLGK